MPHLKLPDSDPVSVHPGTSFREVAESFGPGFAKTVVAASFDGKIYDLDQPLPDADGPTHDLRFLTPQDPDTLGVLRHSTAHILGCAFRSRVRDRTNPSRPNRPSDRANPLPRASRPRPPGSPSRPGRRAETNPSCRP